MWAPGKWWGPLDPVLPWLSRPLGLTSPGFGYFPQTLVSWKLYCAQPRVGEEQAPSSVPLPTFWSGSAGVPGSVGPSPSRVWDSEGHTVQRDVSVVIRRSLPPAPRSLGHCFPKTPGGGRHLGWLCDRGQVTQPLCAPLLIS